jgi:hypothetical protein
MQTGGARLFPGNYMNSSVYVGENDPGDAVGPLALLSRMAGSITLCGHIASWPARQVRRVARHLDAYRSYRHLLMKDFHRLTPYPRDPGDWDAVEFIDPGTTETVLLAYRMRGGESSRTIRPLRLDPARTYEITDPFSSRRSRAASGETLMASGLRISLKPESAAVRHLRPTGP